jgi:cytochrome P450 family 4
MTAATEVVADASTSATNTFYYLLIPALVLGFVYWKLQRRRFVELANKLPGPEGYPIIGNALDFLGSSLRKFNSEYVSRVTVSSVGKRTRSVHVVDNAFYLKRYSNDW